MGETGTLVAVLGDREDAFWPERASWTLDEDLVVLDRAGEATGSCLEALPFPIFDFAFVVSSCVATRVASCERSLPFPFLDFVDGVASCVTTRVASCVHFFLEVVLEWGACFLLEGFVVSCVATSFSTRSVSSSTLIGKLRSPFHTLTQHVGLLVQT